ncbi:hypothetical protein AKJ47_02725 [candidate division MSBL1 archaeon SCGC-AAA261G05]|uniref:ABC transporter domain-containing protein n=2 Tax=candidate division MSBL1 TaxID=215777 RepID=A0A133V9T0_9EURY|nr:hypothetical protein AKJ47_02725 [candidate division MSBL1 archaeon SCGC-AAA261G05]KXB04308.1 hypothetical protein AKJ48_03030 [candidate division MSBL1 archaeon SCGC-AAA261O19]
MRVEDIEKGFPGVWEHLILDEINLDVKAGEIHALLGENGAGKTVLANIMSGFYLATGGQIYIKGEPVTLKSPKDALDRGVGMVHQELTLARPLTVAENVALGLSKSNFSLPLHEVEEKIRELSQRYGLKVDPKAKIEDLSAGEQQRVEILKVLFYEPDVIIMDEPTSVLTPQEVDDLFSSIRALADEGHGVLFITHKLHEALELGDRITVLRLGKLVGIKDPSETDEEELTQMMLGKGFPIQLEREPVKSDRMALETRNLRALNNRGILALKGVDLKLREGEILGIAGISGNGQTELIEVITGLREAQEGEVKIFGDDVTDKSPREILDKDVAHIPEERRRVGVAEPFSTAENMILKDYRDDQFSKWSFLDRSFITEHADELVDEFNILAPDLWRTENRILSGGNIQRLILARELWREPRLIIASHPTHGLDRKAIKHTWELFMHLRDDGSSILLVSEDLDEILSLSDRIAVIYDGEIVGRMDAPEADKEELGLLMMGAGKGE